MKHTTSSMMKNKPLKWAAQKEHHSSPSNNNKSGRVSKRTSTNSRQSQTSTTVSPVKILTAAATETLSTVTKDNTSDSQYSYKKEQVSSADEIARLQRELAFTYDTIATITVHFESLHHAYTRCKPELDKSKTATRLGEMEKELLTAYDDLGLQVTHLERKITKLEKRISELRESPEYIYENNHLQQQQQQSTTASSPSLSVFEENDLHYMPSPCTSTDSLTSDNYLVSYTRDEYFTEEWTEKPKNQCQAQFQVQQVEQQYEQQYQYQQTEPDMIDHNDHYFYQQCETIYPSSFSNNSCNIGCGLSCYDLPEEQTFYSDKAATYGVNPAEIFISYPVYATY